MNVNGTNSVMLTDGTAYSYAPHYNAERDQYVLIVEVNDESFLSDVFVMDGDGDNLTQLTFEAYGSVIARWSPDGEQIVFAASEIDDFAGDLFIMDADGNNLIQLTDTPEVNEFDPMWSPVSDEILFSSGEIGSRQIHIIDANGQNERILTTNSDQRENYQPVWSPDGQQISYVSQQETDANVFIMDADGENRIQLTFYEGVLQTEYPMWSPDGRFIAYSVFDSDAFQTLSIDLVSVSSRETQILIAGRNEFLYVGDWITE